jgi:hypothetical protein
MNIWALNGHKVIVTEDTINNGYECDKINVLKYLTVGTVYTVDYTDVHGWNTDVYLIEFPGLSFNSSSFEDVSEQSEELDNQHPCRNIYRREYD